MTSESVVYLDLTEEECDEKLEEFRGIIEKEIDGNTSAVIGKLLKSEEEEDIDADDETYTKLAALIGGPIPIVLFISYALFQKFWDNHCERVSAEYAAIDPADQADAHSAYMKRAAIATTVTVFLGNLRNLVVKRHERHMGGDILKVTLNRVLLAPVNTFFDVTPVGKILKIFQEEINIFRNHLFDPLKHVIGMLSHVVVVLSTMFLIGFQETAIGMAFMICLANMIIPRYNAADN